MATTLIEAQKHNFPKFQLLLRIYAGTNNLDSKLVKELFASDSSSPRIKRQYLDEHDGIAGWEFENTPPLNQSDEVHTWQLRAFMNASELLRHLSPKLFQRIRKIGNEADLCLVGYNGPIPPALIKELGRLVLGLFVIGLPD